MVCCAWQDWENTRRLAAVVAESVRDLRQTRESLNRKVGDYLDHHDPLRVADLLIKTRVVNEKPLCPR